MRVDFFVDNCTPIHNTKSSEPWNHSGSGTACTQMLQQYIPVSKLILFHDKHLWMPEAVCNVEWTLHIQLTERQFYFLLSFFVGTFKFGPRYADGNHDQMHGLERWHLHLDCVGCRLNGPGRLGSNVVSLFNHRGPSTRFHNLQLVQPKPFKLHQSNPHQLCETQCCVNSPP